MLLNGSLSWRMREHCFDLKKRCSRQNHSTLYPLCTYPEEHYCFKGKKFAFNNVDIQSEGSTQSIKVGTTVVPFIIPEKSEVIYTKSLFFSASV